MSFRLTREQLYELVWSEPMHRLGKQIVISDVAIAKHRRRLGIPPAAARLLEQAARREKSLQSAASAARFGDY